MSITATEPKTNAKLTSPYQDRLAVLDALYGSLPDDITEEEAGRERLNNKYLDCIVTRNIRDYAKSPVPVYTPDEFLKLPEPEAEAR